MGNVLECSWSQPLRVTSAWTVMAASQKCVLIEKDKIWDPEKFASGRRNDL